MHLIISTCIYSYSLSQISLQQHLQLANLNNGAHGVHYLENTKSLTLHLL